jgi:hypothetical protein
VDLVPGEWTRVRIVVSGTEVSEGAVALWIGPGTEAHFSGLRVTPQ